MSSRIETGLRELRRIPSPVHWADIERRLGPDDAGSAWEGDLGPNPRRHRRRVLVAVLSVVAVLGVGWALWPERTDETIRSGPGSTTSMPATSSTTSTSTTSTTIPPTQTERRFSPVTAVANSSYVVWGGEDGTSELDRTDGFVVDVETGAVVPIDPAPIGRAWSSNGAWTGDELIVWTAASRGCDSCDPIEPAGAAWNRETRRWRTIAAPPAGEVIEPAATTWTGSLVVTAAFDGTSWAYDPALDQWQQLPSIPAEGFGQPSLVWTGEQAIVWATQPAGDRGWVWAPGDVTWAPLPDLPPGHRTAGASAVWNGDLLMVWGTASDTTVEDVGTGATWRPGDQSWSPVAASPQPPAAGFEGTYGSQALAVDEQSGAVVVHPLDLAGGIGARTAFVYDPDSDRWSPTTIVIGGWAPTFAVIDRVVVVPDPINAVVGPLP